MPPSQPAASWSHLGVSVAHALTLGGDERIVQLDSGLNKYGCPAAPSGDHVTWSSCSASAPTEFGFDAARRLRDRLLGVPDLSSSLSSQADATRQRLLAVLGLEADEVDVVLAPSATDVEYVPLVLALAQGASVTNILLAPGEVGSGTVKAAAGHHSSALRPSGARGETGRPIEGWEDAPIRLETISVRSGDGEAKSSDVLFGEVRAGVVAALDRGDHVVVHGVDCTKTGLRALSVADLSRLTALDRDRVLAVSDAAQFRTSLETVRAHLQHGQMVFISGTKFYGASPFAGAVLVPRTSLLTDRVRNARLPLGMADYFTQPDLPEAWRHAAGGLSAAGNAGMLLRWEVGLAEMERFEQLPKAPRLGALLALSDAVRKRVASAAHLTLVGDDPALDDIDAVLRSTIVSFRVEDPDQPGRSLSEPDLRALYTWMFEADESDGGLSRRRFNMGQPVRLGTSGRDVMRIAVSAPQGAGLVEQGRPPAGEVEELDDLFGTLSQGLADRVYDPSAVLS